MSHFILWLLLHVNAVVEEELVVLLVVHVKVDEDEEICLSVSHSWEDRGSFIRIAILVRLSRMVIRRYSMET